MNLVFLVGPQKVRLSVNRKTHEPNVLSGATKGKTVCKQKKDYTTIKHLNMLILSERKFLSSYEQISIKS